MEFHQDEFKVLLLPPLFPLLHFYLFYEYSLAFILSGQLLNR